ncbi:GtrA family protein [Nocardioides cynanchi]|uniref:GtrA family protein n=1 Tax=Nocardioides cynanchi TaxID=2558918 RepID=UPI00177B210E|nr:GtrA family protein [Nocardioides cynanchi]
MADKTSTGVTPVGEPGLRRRVLTVVLSRTFRRFALVGLANTGIDVLLFWVLNAPLGIVLANFVSTSAGMTFSFLLNGRHTFGSSRVTVRQAVLFVAANGATMWVLQPVLIHATHDLAAVPLMVAKVVALGGSVVANFLLYRYVVWPERAADSAGGGVSLSARESSEPTAELARP